MQAEETKFMRWEHCWCFFREPFHIKIRGAYCALNFNKIDPKWGRKKSLNVSTPCLLACLIYRRDGH